MNIAMINGSPKYKDSNSLKFLERLEPMLCEDNKIIHYNPAAKPFLEEQYLELCHMDILIFSFPLYVDGIPSHLFRMLISLEEYMKINRQNSITVYTIINNGFYEGIQNHIAMKNWCLRAGLTFGQGIGMGSGEMMGSLDNVPLGQGPLKNLGLAYQDMADNIKSHSTGNPVFLSPNFPKFAWKFSASHFFWNAAARKNGLKKTDLLRQL